MACLTLTNNGVRILDML